MWFEILPAVGVIFAGVSLPGYGLYYLHRGVLGNHNRRSMLDRWERVNYQRDVRLTGNPYKPNALESISD